MKIKSPCCNKKPMQGSKGRLKCSVCGGEFNPVEIASGRVEGGDYDDRRPDARLIMEEEGGPRGAPIRMHRKLKGGLK